MGHCERYRISPLHPTTIKFRKESEGLIAAKTSKTQGEMRIIVGESCRPTDSTERGEAAPCAELNTPVRKAVYTCGFIVLQDTIDYPSRIYLWSTFFFFFILQSTEACFCLRKPYLLSWGKSWHANTISTSKELLHLLTFCQSFSIRSGKSFIVILDASRKPKGILIQGWLHKREGKQAHPLDMQDTVTFQYRAGFERLSCVVAWCM